MRASDTPTPSAGRSQGKPGLLLALVSGQSPATDLMDSFLPAITRVSRLRYARLGAVGWGEIPPLLLRQATLVVASITGAEDPTINLARQAHRAGVQVLLAGFAAHLPPDLAGLAVLSEAEEFRTLLTTLRAAPPVPGAALSAAI